MSSENFRKARDIQPAPTQAPATSQTGSVALKTVIALLSVIILIISGIGYFTVGRLGGGMSSASNLNLGGEDGGGQGFKNNIDGAVDILLVGSDSRTDAHGNRLSDEELAALHAGVDDGEENTDTLMVIRVPDDGSRATAVSIPRDTYVHDEEYGNMKINGVYAAHKSDAVDKLVTENEAKRAEGAEDSELMTDKEIEQAGVDAGRAALLETVRSLTDIEIDHYAEVGLLGFVLLTDAVNGVDVCLNNAVDDPMSGAKFPAGEQTLNGAEALSFVRQRYGLPRNDLDRIVRQQAFMASLVNKVLSTGTLTSPGTLSGISEAVERSVVIDEDWDIMGFATQLANLAGGNVTFNTIPVTSVDGVGDYGESVVTVDPNQVQQFFDDLAVQETSTAAPAPEETEEETEDTGEEPVAEDISLHVLNAGSVTGMASGLTAWLEQTGYTVVETSNAMPGIYGESQIVAADPQDPRALALAEQLGGLPVTANAGLDASSMVIVTADDYSGPLDESSTEPETSTNQPSAEDAVGTPGEDFGAAEVSPEIDAGGDGPRCVN
ncbi:LCP family protein [Corynebacterium sp. L4756]|uniref:LCP family protein n=1 Tax=unclassified Corynebacterium TaxID=2624378 RepID=UPI00374CB318